MPSQLLEQAFHINDHPIVKYVVVAFNLQILCTVLFQFSLDMLLNLLASLILSRLIDLQNRINSFFDRLLVTLLTNSDNLTDDNIL